MKLYKINDKMPTDAEEIIVGINVQDPARMCVANIAPASPHHMLPVYRRFWSAAVAYDNPDWARCIAANKEWCATQYVLHVRPTIGNMELLLGDLSLDTIMAAALLTIQKTEPAFSNQYLDEAITAIREETGLVSWQPGYYSTRETFGLSCIRDVFHSSTPIDIKVEVAVDWLRNGLGGQFTKSLPALGMTRVRGYDSATNRATIVERHIGEEDQTIPSTLETMPSPKHFAVCAAYASSDPCDDLVRVCFDRAPVAIASTDTRHTIALHPGAAVDLDFDRLAMQLTQMEAAALAYQRGREPVMHYLARQPIGWKQDGRRMSKVSTLSRQEVMEAVWACMLGSKKLPAWRACGQLVKTSNNP